MTPEQFCYWLQGRLEMSQEPLTPEETQMVRDHLKTVFTKITPDYKTDPTTYPWWPTKDNPITPTCNSVGPDIPTWGRVYWESDKFC